MNKSTILSILLLLVLPAGINAQNASKEISEAINRYGQTIYYINNYYLDSVNVQKISDDALREVVSKLDPHSVYIPAEDVLKANEQIVGEFEGIGIEFAIILDTLTIQAPVSGGPSERVGIRAGDKIVAVDGENIAGISIKNEDVYKYLRGPKGTRVDLTIKRKGEASPMAFTVTRDKIPLNSLDAAYEIEPGILYLKLGRFAISSNEEIVEAFKKYGKTPKGVILDLRGNSGGALVSSLKLANQFLEREQLILYTEGRAMPAMKEFADGRGIYKSGKLAILIDENSASASEIVSGAVQDWDRGVIIGRRSFGKGLVQQVLPLQGGAELRLTVARYHTPSGRVIQTPYVAGDAENYYREYYKRFSNGESFSTENINFPDSLKYKTLKEGRTVYGGGGIMPDIFVPLDTTYYTNFYAQMLRRGVVLDFVNDLGDRLRADLSKQYKDFDSFGKGYNISKELFSELLSYAKERGVDLVESEVAISRSEIEIYMKALLARIIFDNDAYFKVVNSRNDPALKEAIKQLR